MNIEVSIRTSPFFEFESVNRTRIKKCVDGVRYIEAFQDGRWGFTRNY